MNQYDVFKYKSAGAKSAVGYLIVLQSGHTSALHSMIVAPIAKVDVANRMNKLHIPITVDGKELCIVMPELGSYPAKLLKDPVSNSAELHQDVMTAIDLLFAGI